MSESSYFTQLRTRFFEKGISRRQSDRLIEELQDHLALKEKAFRSQGNNQMDAERLAIESVGTPEIVAESAAAELQNKSWLMRYAWLLCSGGAFIVCFPLQIVITWAGYYLSGSYGYFHDGISEVNLSILQINVLFFNWLPLLMGTAVLALLIRFSSIGWKSIFIASIAIGIAASAMEQFVLFSSVRFSTQPPHLAMHFNIFFQFLFQNWRREGILHLFMPPYPLDVHTKRMLLLMTSISTLFKMFAPFGACLFARYVQPRVERTSVVWSGKNGARSSD
jgi:hypothetical protein